MQLEHTIYLGRTNLLTVRYGFDISNDTFTSQIRKGPSRSSDLLATWSIDFVTDGVDGDLIFTLPPSETQTISDLVGWMDVKRLVNGNAVSGFDGRIKILFEDTVTE